MFGLFMVFLVGGISLYLWVGVWDDRKRGVPRLAYMTLSPANRELKWPHIPAMRSVKSLWWKRALVAAILMAMIIQVLRLSR